jgi:error-prone DNA polymerase
MDLRRIPTGRVVRIAGIVTHRQRPETASGVIFLEDETGIANVITWRSVQESQRQAVFTASLMAVQGELQSEMGVIHVIAQKVRDYSHWLGRLETNSRDFR